MATDLTVLHDMADRLLAWSKTFFPRGTVRDVYAWRAGHGALTLALVGDARKLQRAFGDFERGWDNRGQRIEMRLAKALGVEQRLTNWNGVVGASPQFMDEGSDLYAASFFEGLGGMISSRYDDASEGEATMIPDPGRPHTGATTTYYSALQHKTVRVGPPKWLTTATGRNDDGNEAVMPAADYCQLAPRLDAPGGRAGWFDLGGRQLMVTNSMDFARNGVPITTEGGEAHIDATAESVGRCGGLLFPSLAVGPIPASNFGPCSVIVDPHVVLNALKPVRKPRSYWPVVLYNTDAWTETTRDFVNGYAVALYEELTGRKQWIYSPHFFILGPRMGGVTRSMEEHLRALVSTKDLARVLDRRAKQWMSVTDQKRFAVMVERASRNMVDKYSYLEAKAGAIVGVKTWTGAACADYMVGMFGRFLKGVKYKGPLVSVPTDDEMRGAFTNQSMPSAQADFHRYRFAWAMREAVLASLPSVYAPL